MDSKALFVEKQHFNRILLGGIIFLINIPFLFFLWNVFQSGYEYALADGGHAAITEFFFSVLLLLFLISVRLETKITHEALEVRFFPLQLKFRRYKWEQFAEVSLRKYSPLLEYGGWGLRGLGRNRALNIGGNYGIQLVFHDSSRLLIGTQKQDELKRFLETL